MRRMMIIWLLLCSIVWAVESELQESKAQYILGLLKAGQLNPGESVTGLARRFHVGYDELVSANPHVDFDHLSSGDVLIIPSKHLVLKNNVGGILVNLAERRLYQYSPQGALKKTYPVGIGKEGWDTPQGSLTIIDKRENPYWYVPSSVHAERAREGVTLPKIVEPGPDNPLGSRAMRLSSPSYLIHGTNDPVGIGKRSTAGCISLYPEDVRELYSVTPVDTTVTIINRPSKWYRINDRLCVELHHPLGLDQDDEERAELTQQKFLLDLEKRFTIVEKDRDYWQKIKAELLGLPQCVTIEQEV